ncbi:MAG TPA: hypothetical protein VHA11_07980 [Bryobacteraceae bacterium]|nr:hypothetical protein [Bryobacteraceae bacterium]
MLRGPFTNRVLRALGIDPRRYWLLMDLFQQLSERRDMFSQLGRDETTLRAVTLLYFGMASLAGILAVLARPALDHYFYGALAYTGFVVLSILLPETSNSLVNPVEALVLAHQPIDGATYTAAKLSHLARLVVYLETGLNAVPALAGVMLSGAEWYYPLVHLAAALALGTVLALLCCALFGVLIRIVPAPRLKAAGQLAEIAPWLAFMLREQLRGLLAGMAPAPEARAWVAASGGLIAATGVVLGLRSLSGDYLVRVSAIVHGRSPAKTTPRRSLAGALAARWFAGPFSLAGFAYTSRMMLRDWQFRRQVLPMTLLFLVPALLLGRKLFVSPFGEAFAPLHLLPHACGLLLLLACTFLPYGNDHGGAWIFLLAPAGALGGFARGVYALLWIEVLLIPHALLLIALAWSWGLPQAALFLAYSLAVSSVYLAFELRLIEGVPFAKPPDAAMGSTLLPVLILAGVGTSILVGLQFFVVFRSPAAVAGATAVAAAAAYFLTRSGLGQFETAISFHLAQLAGRYGNLYQEVRA